MILSLNKCAKVQHSAISRRVRNNKRGRQQDDAGEDVPRDFKRIMSFWQGIKSRAGPAIKDKSRDEHPEPYEAGVESPTDLIRRTKSLPEARQNRATAIQPESLSGPGPKTPSTKLGQSEVLRNSRAAKTRLEKKLNRMQEQWRQEEAKSKAKLEQVRTEAEVEDEYAHLWTSVGRSRKRLKRDDPWAKIAAERQNVERVTSGLRGLHDVVQAPPHDLLKKGVKRTQKRLEQMDGRRQS